MKRLVIDIDGTLTIDDPNVDYEDKIPNIEVLAKLRHYKAAGFTIILMTSRNMRTYNASVGLINANTLPVVFGWLAKHDVPYDEIHVGKPWCGNDGFYVDDKAVRPDEFVERSYEELKLLLGGRCK
jgi:capsule biosynthesis phosphatase